MFKNKIHQILQQKFDQKPTPGQEVLFVLLAQFIAAEENIDVLIVKGYAGTGKTSVIGALVQALDLIRRRYVLLTPTGRAAKVLSSYSKRNASTIHKKIYRQRASKDGFGEFVLEKNLHKNTFFIVDEASMIGHQSKDQSIFGSGNLLQDLVDFVYSGEKCKLIIVGDTAQLPPVGLDVSPALDKSFLEGFGLHVREMILTDVVRQEMASGVLSNATHIRETISKNQASPPSLKSEGYDDFRRVYGEELIDLITSSYDKDGVEDTIIITRSNKMANRYNAGIRQRILWHEEEITAGDLLMVVKNNYYWLKEYDENDFIANGDIMRINRIKGYQNIYNHRFADVSVTFLDHDDLEIDTKIILDTLTIEAPSLTYEQNKAFYLAVAEDYQHIKNKRKQLLEIRENPYFNALQVKFSYAITCHKAQGGQWKNVFVDHGYLNESMINRDFLRWLYTAITRTTKNLYAVNFKKDFFEDEK
ncbi:MAG: ATP-dependent DNA helicase [Bacteroidota bacterium]